MVFWSKRRGVRQELPRLRPRVAPTEVTKVDFTELVPDPVPFLGQAAYIQLEFFESLSQAVIGAAAMHSKERLSSAAGVALRKHHDLIAELRRLDVEPDAVMAPFAPATDRLGQSTAGADQYELMLGIHVTSGMLDDYFTRLAEGLPVELRARVRSILAVGGIGEVLDAELRAAIEAEPGLADRLALWGRSIVGDTLLIARSALRGSEPADRTGDRVEPVFTELIAEHTRRMDALGLTA
ncbi:ferritin-like fold-containing protein [Agromyces sp. H3Y2-19a]|uniref:ferritin-like fold-containing protein n=1 Tax=Agromyces TaxID=33877 RepID=UPI001E55138B|nr:MULTISPECIES: ferritin-like fold-containing protein [Agromyces]MCD5346680.1 ferritin-like fold-containing protein [Agromyces sp. S2-1-8]MDF0513040.1 ferritin-like fold-containing protein [Agromyces chromiiresistens]